MQELQGQGSPHNLEEEEQISKEFQLKGVHRMTLHSVNDTQKKYRQWKEKEKKKHQQILSQPQLHPPDFQISAQSEIMSAEISDTHLA